MSIMATDRAVIIQRRPSVIQEVPRAQVTKKMNSQAEECMFHLGEKNRSDTTKTLVSRTKRESKKRHYNYDSVDEEWRPTGNKRHRCVHCPMRFKKPSALRIHMRIHSGERPYKCDLCSKSFSISGNLRRHMFTHTGEKPYKCNSCGKAFNNPSHLTRHSKKIHI